MSEKESPITDMEDTLNKKLIDLLSNTGTELKRLAQNKERLTEGPNRTTALLISEIQRIGTEYETVENLSGQERIRKLKELNGDIESALAKLKTI
ncbi:MAG: hypothetical protein HYT15_03345 [Candidatus Magasanikbacteria bacterium]|nr:hypothetical protein [Candidatus Magasanikbacteria bacterium]